MEKLELHILGCGSALPTTRHFPTSQVLNVRDKLFMIDCGEGAQQQFRRQRLRFSRLHSIFISHLHGDHCFGLPGLVSTLNLLGRTAQLHIYSPAGLEEMMRPLIDFCARDLTYELCFHPFATKKPEVIYEDRTLTVTTIPLRHRMPCCGFLFAEKPRPNHLLREWTDFYGVPVSQFGRIKNGEDFVLPDGTVVPNARLTTPAAPPRSYAYCSDTVPLDEVADQVRGVNLLFHEATFANDAAARARETFHSTAAGAAGVAARAGVKRLVIGHFSARYDDETPILDEARQHFAPTIAAHEGMVIEID